MIMDIGRFELELENALKEIQNISTKVREMMVLRADAYVIFPCVEDFKIEKKDLSVKHTCRVEDCYNAICQGLECKSLPIKIPGWMNKKILSLWKYNGKTEHLMEKMICGLTSFRAFVDFVDNCWNLCRECDKADFFVDEYEIKKLLEECEHIGDELWCRHKEKFYKFLVLDGIHFALEECCVDSGNVYLDCNIVVDYILKEFKNCCEKYGLWRICVVLDEEHGRL